MARIYLFFPTTLAGFEPTSLNCTNKGPSSNWAAITAASCLIRILEYLLYWRKSLRKYFYMSTDFRAALLGSNKNWLDLFKVFLFFFLSFKSSSSSSGAAVKVHQLRPGLVWRGLFVGNNLRPIYAQITHPSRKKYCQPSIVYSRHNRVPLLRQFSLNWKSGVLDLGSE